MMKTKSKAVYKKLFLTIFIIAIIAPLIFVAVLFTLTITSNNYVKFDPHKISMYNTEIKSEIYNYDNEKLDTKSIMFSNHTKYEELNQFTIDAFVSTEDKKFFNHNGIDIKRIVGATKNNIISGRYKEGASTITQQLAKNIFLNSNKNLKRKINEVMLTFKIEENYSKEEIFEAYINNIYFGGENFGIKKASYAYFGISPSNLTLGQSAGLAGLIKAPNNYSPINNLEKYNIRKKLVLNQLLEDKKIDKFQFEQALSEEYTKSSYKTLEKESECLEIYVKAVLNQASKLLGIPSAQIATNKYKIHTYLEEETQKNLVNSFLNEKTSLNSKINKCGVVLENKNNGITAFYSNKIGFDTKNINPGSTLKPLAVFAPALELNKISPITPVLDERMTFSDGFSPSNYKNNYLGWTSIRNAVAKSQNIPAVKTANIVGLKNCLHYLNENGFDADEKNLNLTLSLGNLSGGCSPQQLIDGYATLARNGEYKMSNMIKKIEYDGKILYAHKNEANKKIYKNSTAFLMTNILMDVTKHGTADKLKKLPYNIAGKTGTVGKKNGENSDALFCGYTTQNTFLFWIGGLDNVNMLDKSITGGNQPVAIAKTFLEDYYTDKNFPNKFEMPKSVKKIKIDKVVLEKNQKITIASQDTPKKEIIIDFFDIKNSPKTLSDRLVQSSKVEITAVYDNGIVNINTNNGMTKIYKINEGKKVYIGKGKIITDKVKQTPKIIIYIAEINGEEKARVEVYIKDDDNLLNEKDNEKQNRKKDKKNIFEYWFL